MRFLSLGVRLAGLALLSALIGSCGGSSPTPSGPSATASGVPFSVTGMVRDSLLRPIAGARVEVDQGPSAGRFTITNDQGRFTLDAPSVMADPVGVRVTREGFASTVWPARNHSDVIVQLTAVALVDLEGRYGLTVTANQSCSAVPATVRTRNYTADMTRHATARPLFIGELRGGEFYSGYGKLSAIVGDDAVRVILLSWDAYERWLDDYPIIERVTPSTHLSLRGTANGSSQPNPTTVGMTFDGTISYCAESKPSSTPEFPADLCGARDHVRLAVAPAHTGAAVKRTIDTMGGA
jgi:hypothetical protein